MWTSISNFSAYDTILPACARKWVESFAPDLIFPREDAVRDPDIPSARENILSRVRQERNKNSISKNIL